MTSVVSIADLKAARQVQRKSRHPQHPANIRFRPYVIQPFMIAPVLPGERLDNLTWQCRAVTDPIKNPLIGWWYETAFFYVKLRDLIEGPAGVAGAISEADLLGMLSDPAWSNDGIDTTAANTSTYHAGGVDAIDWMSYCLARIVQCYYRDAGDTCTFTAAGAWTGTTLDGLPQAYINQTSWWDSVVNEDAYKQATDSTLTVGGDGLFTGTEIENLMRTHEMLKFNNLTDMDLDDWLATFGQKLKRAELREPELIRFNREWTYPTNHINTSTGAPTSACSWSIKGSADKARHFKEWGFIVGVSLVRPKVYLRKQKGSVASFMNSMFPWLPAVLRDDPSSSLKLFADGAGPLASLDLTDNDGYWMDYRDYFMYGDQFINYDLAATDANLVDLPTVGLEKRYVPETSMEAMFVTADVDKVKADYIVNLHISGDVTTATDNTPAGAGRINIGGV